MDVGWDVNLRFLDFSRDFDVVNQGMLSAKLAALGVS